jgi:hypothetical protein
MADATRHRGRRTLDFVDAVEGLSRPGVIKLFESEGLAGLPAIERSPIRDLLPAA